MYKNVLPVDICPFKEALRDSNIQQLLKLLFVNG